MTVTENPIFNYSVEERQLQLDKVCLKYGKTNAEEVLVTDCESQECVEELRSLYKVSSYLRQIWNFELGFVKAEGTPDYSAYDMALAGLLREWSVEKVVWVIDFFREEHNLKPKHRKAILMTVGKARL